MERREFVQRGATLAGGAALLGVIPAEADAAKPRGDLRDVAPEPASLESRLADAHHRYRRANERNVATRPSAS